MAKKKRSQISTDAGNQPEKMLTQMDWSKLSDYQQTLADKGYLDKAKNYLNNIQNKISQDNQRYGHSAYGAPYGDPAWSGGYTAQVMKLQDYFHPTGVDRSNQAMTDIGQSLADKLQGSFASPAQQAQAIGSMKRLESIGNKRGIDLNQPSVSEYLRLLEQGGS